MEQISLVALTAEEAVTQCQSRMPSGVHWPKATVYHIGGLTLTSNNGEFSVRFPWASCGHADSGAEVTITVLQLVGYGDEESLRPLIRENIHLELHLEGDELKVDVREPAA